MEFAKYGDLRRGKGAPIATEALIARPNSDHLSIPHSAASFPRTSSNVTFETADPA